MKILTTIGYVQSVYLHITDAFSSSKIIYDTTSLYLHQANIQQPYICIKAISNNNIHNSFLIRISLRDMRLLRVITYT